MSPWCSKLRYLVPQPALQAWFAPPPGDEADWLALTMIGGKKPAAKAIEWGKSGKMTGKLGSRF